MPETKKEIAARVRELRDCCGIELEKMATIAGISTDEYLQMETGKVDFPASSLVEIAAALNADMTEILTGRPAHMNAFSVTRSGDGVSINRTNQYGYENLASSFIHKKCEPFIVTVPITASPPELNSHPGQEFVYMLEGSMLVQIAENKITLEVGDSLYIDSTKPHSMETTSESSARFLAVIL